MAPKQPLRLICALCPLFRTPCDYVRQLAYSHLPAEGDTLASQVSRLRSDELPLLNEKVMCAG